MKDDEQCEIFFCGEDFAEFELLARSLHSLILASTSAKRRRISFV